MHDTIIYGMRSFTFDTDPLIILRQLLAKREETGRRTGGHLEIFSKNQLMMKVYRKSSYSGPKNAHIVLFR